MEKEKILKITDDSGFLGIADLNKFNAHIGKDWNFDLLKNKIIEETKKNHIIFWATGREDFWNIKLSTDQAGMNNNGFQNEEALIEVTDNKIHLVNYETISMAAQFEETKLPEKHLSNHYFELKNGLYIVSFSQLIDPNNFEERAEVDFEINFEFVSKPADYHPNDFESIFWYYY